MTDQPTLPPPARRSAFEDKPVKPRKIGGSWLAWAIVLVLGGIVLIVEAPYELAKWKYAAALDAREKGQDEPAYQYLNEAMERLPQKAEYKLRLAVWKLEDGEYEGALALFQELMAIEPENPVLLMMRSQAFQHLKRYPEAIADLKMVKRISEATGLPERAETLNTLAYARAVAKLELDEALVDAQEAVKLAGVDLTRKSGILSDLVTNKRDTKEYHQEVAKARMNVASYVDTRGLVQLNLGLAEQARADFDQAIKLAVLASKVTEERPQSSKVPAPEKTEKVPAKPEKTRQQKLMDRNMAVLYYHRGLSLQKLEREKEAESDFAKATELLGREPDENLF
ncbi:tetratricopeptide repeat protein [Anatilimnocola sp. NA78]|uniref:tetratricopeptide repeat protein n=1 Tax=Anatilimnocola sp. NA78 TaxID=3415683 RepID=UPI003CE55DA1